MQKEKKNFPQNYHFCYIINFNCVNVKENSNRDIYIPLHTKINYICYGAEKKGYTKVMQMFIFIRDKRHWTWRRDFYIYPVICQNRKNKKIYIVTYQRQQFEKHMQIFEDQLHYDPSMKLFHNLNQLLVYNLNVIVQSKNNWWLKTQKKTKLIIPYFTGMQSWWKLCLFTRWIKCPMKWFSWWWRINFTLKC